MFSRARVLREYGGSGESEEIVFFERSFDGYVHVAKLGTVAFVEDEDYVTVVNGVALVGFDECCKFLNGGDDDFLGRIRAFELSFELRG